MEIALRRGYSFAWLCHIAQQQQQLKQQKQTPAAVFNSTFLDYYLPTLECQRRASFHNTP